MDAQFERLVPLQHQDRPGLATGDQHGGDLSPTSGQVALEALEVRRLVTESPVHQAEEELAAHLGEAPVGAAEQVVGVVDSAVVGADDVRRVDEVVVVVDALIAPGVSHEKDGPVVYPGQDILLERLVGDELPGRNVPHEESVLAVAVEPSDAGDMWPLPSLSTRSRVKNHVRWLSSAPHRFFLKMTLASPHISTHLFLRPRSPGTRPRRSPWDRSRSSGRQRGSRASPHGPSLPAAPACW